MRGFLALEADGSGFQWVVDLLGAAGRGLARVTESPFVRTQLVEEYPSAAKAGCWLTQGRHD